MKGFKIFLFLLAFLSAFAFLFISCELLGLPGGGPTPTPPTVVQISAGYYHTIALKSERRFYYSLLLFLLNLIILIEGSLLKLLAFPHLWIQAVLLNC
jgi:hypothetical protein